MEIKLVVNPHALFILKIPSPLTQVQAKPSTPPPVPTYPFSVMVGSASCIVYSLCRQYPQLCSKLSDLSRPILQLHKYSTIKVWGVPAEAPL